MLYDELVDGVNRGGYRYSIARYEQPFRFISSVMNANMDRQIDRTTRDGNRALAMTSKKFAPNDLTRQIQGNQLNLPIIVDRINFGDPSTNLPEEVEDIGAVPESARPIGRDVVMADIQSADGGRVAPMKSVSVVPAAVRKPRSTKRATPKKAPARRSKNTGLSKYA